MTRLDTALRALGELYSHFWPERGHEHRHYVNPPERVRYTLERWTHTDVLYNRESGETHAPVHCSSCYGLHGAYCEGEYIIDDTLSLDTFHVRCAPPRIRLLALIGTIVCAFRAVMGIDGH